MKKLVSASLIGAMLFWQHVEPRPPQMTKQPVSQQKV